MQGTRIMPRKDGYLEAKEIAQPGAYGRATAFDNNSLNNSALAFWRVTAPNGDQCCLNPTIHQIVEHEDGTITVSPSIQFLTGGKWHGFLKRGYWTEA